MKIKKQYEFSKVGINEVVGLKDAMKSVILPLQAAVKENVYWNDCVFEESEYNSRDGFIAHSENCGGLELVVIIPKCESYDFDFLEFGECDECGNEELGLDRYGSPKQCGYNGDECGQESDGHLDAKLRIWLKFEGIKDDVMNFYLYCGGGNADAPYFRVKYEPTVFEVEFTAKSLFEFKRKAKIQVAKLIKQIS